MTDAETIQVGELCRRLNVPYRSARYVLEALERFYTESGWGKKDKADEWEAKLKAERQLKAQRERGQ